MTVFSPSSKLTAASPERHRPARSSWLNVVTHLDPKYGGISTAVPALSSAVFDSREHEMSLAAFCAPGERVAPSLMPFDAVHYMPLGRINWLKDKTSRSAFREMVDKSAGVHIHGLWEQSTFAAARAARSAGKPYLVSAHGMLQPWALNNKGWKKAIYGALIERTNLRNAKCLHALTTSEANDYRTYKLNHPIAIIPNGVNLPESADSSAFLNQFSELRGKRLVLFLSRLHFKKGLDILCLAWKSAAKRWPDAHLVLAGPDLRIPGLPLSR